MEVLFHASLFWVGVLASWIFASSLWVYPHSLSYFNESVSGPLNGPKHLLGSNVDWGQDILYARQWYDGNVSRAENVTLLLSSSCCVLWGDRIRAFGDRGDAIYDSEVANKTIQIMGANILHGQQCVVGLDPHRVYVPPNAVLSRKAEATTTSSGYSLRVLDAVRLVR